jgi:hypothetical protein
MAYFKKAKNVWNTYLTKVATDEIHLLLSALEPYVDRANLDAVLLPNGRSAVLPALLNRAMGFSKNPRDYSLSSFSGLYRLALPFMRAGEIAFQKGEGIYINEVIQMLANRGGRPDKLILASDDDSKVKYEYSQGVEAEIMAEMYLKTGGGDTYEGCLVEFLELLASASAISESDNSVIKDALLATELRYANKKIQVLNPLPGYHAKNAFRKSAGDTEPASVNKIFTQPVEILDERSWNLDLMTPVIKDLLERAKGGTLAAQSVSLSALSPIMAELSDRGYLGVVFQIEEGRIKKLTLPKHPESETLPPLYGPYRGMLSILQVLSRGSATILNNYNVDALISQMKQKQGFFAVITSGAVSAPSEPQLSYVGSARPIKDGSVKLVPAIETFTFLPQTREAGAVDPVAVPYVSIMDPFECFSATRLCFYATDPTSVSAVHQGAICIGPDSYNYESACWDDGGVARKILEESASFITGEYGQDQIAYSVPDVIVALSTKYALSPALRNIKSVSESMMWEIISGKYGATHGLTSEVYSLFYQNDSDTSPISFGASIHAAKFLCDVRTLPQRFDIKSFLG